jgi:hypothetical protein
MKKISMLSLFGALLLMMTACNMGGKENLDPEKDFQTVTVKNTYKMSVPKYMKASTELNDDASLQYMNILKEAYVVVIDESKQEYLEVYQGTDIYNDSLSALENYSTVQKTMYGMNVEDFEMQQERSLSINGLDAIQIEFTGRVEGVNHDIFYFITFVEGPENMYMIMSWTVLKRKSLYYDTYQKIAASFQLA